MKWMKWMNRMELLTIRTLWIHPNAWKFQDFQIKCPTGLEISSPNCIIVLIQRVSRSTVVLRNQTVRIHISTTDGVPIYLQIVNQIKYLVASGSLAPGAELPAIRVLAEQLIVNPNTVARAYRELESAGVVEKRRTAGTFVSDQTSPLARRERLKILAERVDALLAEAGQMAISFDELLTLVRQRQTVLESSREKE